MKARIEVPKCYKEQVRQQCDDYVREELRKQQLELVKRTMKIVSVVLHQKFGFGKERLERVYRAVSEHGDLMAEDPVAWYHIDKELICDVGLNLPREDYEVMDD